MLEMGAHVLSCWLIQGTDTSPSHPLLHEESYAVASYSCSMAFCSCVGLAAWRADKLQQNDATGYYLDPTVLQRLFTSGDQQLAHLLEAVLNQVLEAQMAEQVQAERYERTEQRQGHRNGYKPRQLTTRASLTCARDSMRWLRPGTSAT
jgi:hypothetical protein